MLTLQPLLVTYIFILFYNITPESCSKVTRIKKMITSLKKLLIDKQILLVSTLEDV